MISGKTTLHPETVRQRAIALYESGLSCRVVAGQLTRELPTAITPQTVARWARELGINRPVGEPRRVELPHEAIRLYESGQTLEEVGKRFRMCGTTVAERLREMGVQMRRRTLRYAELADRGWLEDRYRGKGQSAKEIAGSLGCSVLTVHYHLRRHGILRKRRRHA